MAIVKFGTTVHSMTGKLQGSFFRNNTYGSVLQSNNWSKRGHGARHATARFIMASITSSWRDLTVEERAAWNANQLPNVPQFRSVKRRIRFQ
jgi:hypothetical protein